MIQIKGMEPLIAKLEKGINFDGAQEVVKMNGVELHKSAQRLAPVDTGHLKRSITLTVNEGGLRAEVKPTAEYAPYLEYGTRYIAAQPFIRPSYQKQREQFLADLKRLVK